MERFGKIRINLAKLLEESGLSKNMLSHRAEMQRTQLNHYCSNTITRLDIEVLARLCTVLNCEIGGSLSLRRRKMNFRKDLKHKYAKADDIPGEAEKNHPVPERRRMKIL